MNFGEKTVQNREKRQNMSECTVKRRKNLDRRKVLGESGEGKV